MLAPLENVSDEVALSTFINDLCPNIRTELRVLQPNNLGRAIDLAQKIEEKILAAAAPRPSMGRIIGNTRMNHSIPSIQL